MLRASSHGQQCLSTLFQHNLVRASCALGMGHAPTLPWPAQSRQGLQCSTHRHGFSAFAEGLEHDALKHMGRSTHVAPYYYSEIIIVQ